MEFSDILKIGRTHLQDATPITLGQEFSGYKEIISKNIKRININKSFLSSLAQGGTAVGTGINTHKNFGKKIAEEISKFTNIKFIESKNHFESQSSQDSIVGFSGDLKTLAVGLSKIANDLKISINTLKQIENHEFEHKLYDVFFIGHLRSYSNYLDLNSEEIIKIFKMNCYVNVIKNCLNN